MLINDFFTSEIIKANKSFSNSYLNKIYQLTSLDFYLEFSKDKRNGILISLNATLPFFTNIKAPSLTGVISPFLKTLKTLLMNAKLINISLENDDNIISLSFNKTNDLYDKIEYKLIIELFKLNSNIILISNKRIICALRHKGLETNHPTINGINYDFPSKTQYFREFSIKDSQFINSYINNLESKYLSEKYKPIILSIKRKLKSLERKMSNILKDKNDAIIKLKYKDYADILLMNLEGVKKGDKYLMVNDLNIELNQNLTPVENLNKFYKIYKKSRQTISSCAEQIEKATYEIEYLKYLLDEIDFFNEKDFDELIVELNENKIVKVPHISLSKKIKSSIKPYYIEYEGTKIGFGKNNLQNDYLTFNLALKNNYFLHINKEHGPHVIIFNDNPDDKLIQLACEIALHLAKKTDGDVIFTQVKFLKKFKEPGKVKLSKYETYHISNFKNNISLLLLNSKRF